MTTPTLRDDEIRALREVAGKATNLDWRRYGQSVLALGRVIANFPRGGGRLIGNPSIEQAKLDAAHIVAFQPSAAIRLLDSHDALVRQVEQLRAALKKIATEHQDYYDETLDPLRRPLGEYRTGVVDGHRCAAQIARAALAAHDSTKEE